ncbi:uncharacterized protein [Dysidea avara]|uniref:uncharacterized protein n=1 Tax=Dysidea avara TaxID=196820 RepID=UPI003326068C
MEICDFQRAMICCYLLIMIVSVTCITVYPDEDITQGNCSQKLDAFLCHCLSSNVTVYLSPGDYTFHSQDLCMTVGKKNIAIIGTGNSPSDTTIRCDGGPFNMLFLNTHNITIGNIRIIGCGGLIDASINETYVRLVPVSYFGRGSRYVLMVVNSSNVTIEKLIMQHSLGYGFLGWNTHGTVRLSQVYIENTTFENDPNCANYDYNSNSADFSCSGSGLLLIYSDFGTYNESCNFIIDGCVFRNNRNSIPTNEHKKLSFLVDTAYYHGPIPPIGAGGIAVFSVQTTYAVTTTVNNTLFYNNNGSYSASVAIAVIHTVENIFRFENCLFEDNNRISLSFVEDEFSSLYRRGGIVFHYLVLRGGVSINLPDLPTTHFTELEMITLTRCNFTKLGGTRGAAMHIEKISPDYITIVVRVEQVNFVENEADVGSAIYSKLSEFRVSLQYEGSRGIQFNLIDVNAVNNKISSGANLNYGASGVFRGVFSFENCQAYFQCNHQCKFTDNQPSVIYGHNAGVVISGRAVFEHNKAIYGGAVWLHDTIVYIHAGSKLWFKHNIATSFGGAINIHFTNTNVQTEDVCPIQFIGNSSAIFDVENLDKLNVSIGFSDNYAFTQTSLQSIFSNVFYVCSWYPDTLTQIDLGIHTPVINGTRDSVYRRVFDFYPNDSANNHLFILAYVPCPCDEALQYNVTSCLNEQQVNLNKPVVPGRSFNISIVSLDVVGSVGYSSTLYSRVYHRNVIEKQLILGDGQNRRSFFTYSVNKTCTNVDFVVYGQNPEIPNNGTLEISLTNEHHRSLWINFKFSNCSVGFKLGNESFAYGCVCDDFFDTKTDGRFECDTTTGNITRHRRRAWLSVVGGDLQYARICSPTFCNEDLISFSLSEEDLDVLCTNHHSGRVCGGCEDGFSRVFGSDTCKKCDNAWLATIVLYAILGVVLVVILFLFNFNVTLGTINGLIFFCNVMSMNEQLFFNTEISRFSFLRVFISLINLDLGFEICFYDGMSQLVKTGLQFVFPVYLWLLMLIIIYTGKFYFRAHKLSSYSAVPVLSTLILLAYSKLLRSTISVFAFDRIQSSEYGSIVAWQPDPTVEYFTGGHIVLFLVGTFFLLVFIIPFVIFFIFPSIILRSKRLSYFFPIFDCYFAPYKVKYRYWFGLRALLLLFLSGMEAIIFTYKETFLLSSIAIVGCFTIVQASFHPFKDKLINFLDLIFMSIFLLLATVTLYLYPSTEGYDEVSIVVKVLGSLSFVFFCLIVLYHSYHITRHTRWNMYLTDIIWNEVNNSSVPYHFLSSQNSSQSDISQRDHNYRKLESIPPHARFRESLLEQM